MKRFGSWDLSNVGRKTILERLGHEVRLEVLPWVR